MIKSIHRYMKNNSHFHYMPFGNTIIYKNKNQILSKLLDLSLKTFILRKFPVLAKSMFEPFIGERIVEYPFVFMNLGVKNGKILDVGCYGTNLPIELASYGYEVYGIDLMDYPIKHPNFRFIKGDITITCFPDMFFDCITAVSTIEHVGLGCRFGGEVNPDGDKKAIEEIKRILKPDGKLIITVPFGKKTICHHQGIPFHRVYDLDSFKKLLSPFKKFEINYARKKGQFWFPAKIDEVKNVEGEGSSCMAVALAVAFKGESSK